MKFSVDIRKLIQKFTSKDSGPVIAKTILTKNEFQEITSSNIKAYYVAIVIKTV